MATESKVNKKIVLEILDRALRPDPNSERIFTDPELRKKEIFRGQAKHWEKFDQKEFQAFMKKHGLTPENRIDVADLGNDAFGVIKTKRI